MQDYLMILICLNHKSNLKNLDRLQQMIMLHLQWMYFQELHSEDNFSNLEYDPKIKDSRVNQRNMLKQVVLQEK